MVYNAKLQVYVPEIIRQIVPFPIQAVQAQNDQHQNLSNVEEEVWVDIFYVSEDTTTKTAKLVQIYATRVQVLEENGRWIGIDMMEFFERIWPDYPKDFLLLHLNIKTRSGEVIPIGVQHQNAKVRTMKIM